MNSMPRSEMSAGEARRTIVAAQGLADARPSGRVDRRHLRRVIGRLGLLQIDSVNVLARAHYVPLFSRLGPYDPDALDRMAYEDHELFEYWGHVASLIDVRHEPDLRWRMADNSHWHQRDILSPRMQKLIDELERLVHDLGPISSASLRELTGETPSGKPWWGWTNTKRGLEYLFHNGRISAVRSGTFERLYCHPDLAIPTEIRARPTPDEAEARRNLLRTAARAQGVGTARDLADYWRFKVGDTTPILDAMVAEGDLERVAVEGWDKPAYRHPDARTPRRVDACALVSPFDVSMWERDRILRVHDFDYKIEIYVPEPKRIYGYYSLPFLLGDTFVARVDLKADRATATLLVQSAHMEGDLDRRGTDPGDVATRLAGELTALAEWIGMADISVKRKGDLARRLIAAVA